MQTVTAIEPRTVKLPGAGLSLAADLYGDETDPPVVLLHGGGQTRHAWGGAAAAFAAANATQAKKVRISEPFR